jgi:hypothetical protein
VELLWRIHAKSPVGLARFGVERNGAVQGFDFVGTDPTSAAEMIQTGVVVPSMSPYASLVLLVKNKDGQWRFCVDYRKLNSITIKNKFPLPIVDKLLDELAGFQILFQIGSTRRLSLDQDEGK